MRTKRLVATLLALGLGGACSATSDPSPGDDDAGGSSNVAGSGGATSTGTGTGTGTSTGTPTGTECYANQGACNPMLADQCAEGEACDVSADAPTFQCRVAPNTLAEGNYCDPATSSFCMHGLTCAEHICEAYCCSIDDCGGSACALAATVGNIQVRVCALN
jgi:hypothetical protein